MLPELSSLPPFAPAVGLAGAIIVGAGALWSGAHHAVAKLTPAREKKLTQVRSWLFADKVTNAEALVIFACSLAGVVAAGTIGGLSLQAIVLLAALFVAVPALFYFRASGRHVRDLEKALPLALQQVANEMAAGATIETALRKVSSTAPAPADVEMTRLLRRVEVMGVDAAFAEMAEKLNIRSFTITASVVRVGTSSGGQLVSALKSLSRTLIEIERLNRKIRTASENGRRNLYLMSIIGPLVAVGAGMSVSHEHSALNDPLGQVLMGISALLFIAAHAIGYAFTKVKV